LNLSTIGAERFNLLNLERRINTPRLDDLNLQTLNSPAEISFSECHGVDIRPILDFIGKIQLERALLKLIRLAIVHRSRQINFSGNHQERG
jgi:hypothetical protein